MGVYQRPKKFKERFDFVGELFPRWATGARSGPGRCPAASGRWSPWAGR